MKPMTNGLALLAVLAMIAPVVSGPAAAETKYDVYQRCIGKSMADDSSAECIALRQSYESLLQNCMSAAAAARKSSASNASYTSHGYKARFLLCKNDTQQQLEN